MGDGPQTSLIQSHLLTYALVNAGLWLIWVFDGAHTYGNILPWPAWNTLGWGIGLVLHYISAYRATGFNSVENEYNKLTQNNSK